MLQRDCLVCSRFLITRRGVESALAKGLIQWREGFALEEKRAPEGKMLSLTLPSPIHHVSRRLNAVISFDWIDARS